MQTLDLQDNPAYQLWLATNAYQRLVRRALEPLGLTHVQFVVLAAASGLCTGEHLATQADVCRFAAIDANMTSQVVRSLESKGFLERVVHPEDARAHRLLLTDTGRELLDKARKELLPVKESFFAPLGPDGKRLAEMLASLVAACPSTAGSSASKLKKRRQ